MNANFTIELIIQSSEFVSLSQLADETICINKVIQENRIATRLDPQNQSIIVLSAIPICPLDINLGMNSSNECIHKDRNTNKYDKLKRLLINDKPIFDESAKIIEQAIIKGIHPEMISERIGREINKKVYEKMIKEIKNTSKSEEQHIIEEIHEETSMLSSEFDVFMKQIEKKIKKLKTGNEIIKQVDVSEKKLFVREKQAVASGIKPMLVEMDVNIGKRQAKTKKHNKRNKIIERINEPNLLDETNWISNYNLIALYSYKETNKEITKMNEEKDGIIYLYGKLYYMKRSVAYKSNIAIIIHRNIMEMKNFWTGWNDLSSSNLECSMTSKLIYFEKKEKDRRVAKQLLRFIYNSSQNIKYIRKVGRVQEHKLPTSKISFIRFKENNSTFKKTKSDKIKFIRKVHANNRLHVLGKRLRLALIRKMKYIDYKLRNINESAKVSHIIYK